MADGGNANGNGKYTLQIIGDLLVDQKKEIGDIKKDVSTIKTDNAVLKERMDNELRKDSEFKAVVEKKCSDHDTKIEKLESKASFAMGGWKGAATILVAAVVLINLVFSIYQAFAH